MLIRALTLVWSVVAGGGSTSLVRTLVYSLLLFLRLDQLRHGTRILEGAGHARNAAHGLACVQHPGYGRSRFVPTLSRIAAPRPGVVASAHPSPGPNDPAWQAGVS